VEIKISEKFVVIKVEQARSVIGHLVVDSWEVVFESEVTVVALM
jgi:hypothetical protein